MVCLFKNMKKLGIFHSFEAFGVNSPQKFCHYLFTYMLFQAHTSFLLDVVLHLHNFTGDDHKGTCFSYQCYLDDIQLYLLFQPDDSIFSAHISASLPDISAWMKEHHLQLNFAKMGFLQTHQLIS